MPTFRSDLESIPRYIPGRPIDEVAKEFGLTSIEGAAIAIASSEADSGEDICSSGGGGGSGGFSFFGSSRLRSWRSESRLRRTKSTTSGFFSSRISPATPTSAYITQKSTKVMVAAIAETPRSRSVIHSIDDFGGDGNVLDAHLARCVHHLDE